MTYTFKPEFETKLKRLRIKTKFLYNFKHHSLYPIKSKAQLDAVDEQINWYYFILAGFCWDRTPEGTNYWNEIAIDET